MNAVKQVQTAIKEAFAKAIQQAGIKEDITAEDIHLETPKQKENGDYATNMAMQLTKVARKAPRMIVHCSL